MRFFKRLKHLITMRVRNMLGIEARLASIEKTLLSSIQNSHPVDNFITQSFRSFTEGHFHSHYPEWRVRRIQKILEIYGTDFKGKKILEVGGGIGDIGGFFASLGAEVTALEGRQRNANFANLRYGRNFNYKSVVRNLEEDFSNLGRFDLVINFGFLEVINDIDNVMGCCAKLADEIVLETMVSDSTDKTKVFRVDMDPSGIDNPISGKSSRPSPFYIEDFFEKRGFKTERYFHADLNTEAHSYDWQHKNDGDTEDNRRRFWRFVKK